MNQTPELPLGRYLIWDLECGTEKGFKTKSNPFMLDEEGNYSNAVYYNGYRRWDDCQNRTYYNREPKFGLGRRLPSGFLDDIDIVVGFNVLGYDAMFYWDDPQWLEFIDRGGRVHDCQYAEYLLMAQHQKAQMCSLNDCAVKYGGEVKLDVIAEMWKAGIKTYDIPEDLMLEYLIGKDNQGGDIGNTLLVYKGQVERLNQLRMQKAWLLRMDGMLCTSHMRFKGIKVDTVKAEELLTELTTEQDALHEKLLQYLPTDLPPEIEWKWSNRQKSAILFGGALPYQWRGPVLDEEGNECYTKEKEDRYLWQGRPVPPSLMTGKPGVFRSKTGMLYECDKFLGGKRKGEYKTKKVDVPGKLKTKLYDYLYHLPRMVTPDPEWATSIVDRAGNIVYSTGDEQMEALQHVGIPFCTDLSRYAALIKEIGTYYRRDKGDGEVGMLTLVQPWDSILHHRLDHTLTVTTRLSSSSPNMQNLPRKDKSKVKQMFVSRFGDEGVMIEADYSQLEVVGMGVLSNDPHLRADLNKGIDFHCKRVSARFGCTYEEAVQWCKDESYPDYKLWKERRTECKVFSFQRAYGAGAKKISATTGISLEAVEAMIEAEDALYPGVPQFHKAVEQSVNRTARPFFDPVLGMACKRGYWQSPTGTLYGFRSYPAPAYLKKQGIMDSFMPTEIKNYPTQGESGFFVQAVLGKLIRHFIKCGFYGGKAYLVNTVHDCIWVDCHKDVLHVVAENVKRIMQSIPEMFNAIFDMEIDVPFPVEVEVGANMYDLTHYNKDH